MTDAQWRVRFALELVGLLGICLLTVLYVYVASWALDRFSDRVKRWLAGKLGVGRNPEE